MSFIISSQCEGERAVGENYTAVVSGRHGGPLIGQRGEGGEAWGALIRKKGRRQMRRDGEDSLQMAAAAWLSPFQLSPVLGGHKSPALCLPVSLFYRASELPGAFQSLGCCSLTFIGPLGTNMHQNPAAILPIDGLQRHYLSELCCTFLPQSLL